MNELIELSKKWLHDKNARIAELESSLREIDYHLKTMKMSREPFAHSNLSTRGTLQDIDTLRELIKDALDDENVIESSNYE